MRHYICDRDYRVRRDTPIQTTGFVKISTEAGTLLGARPFKFMTRPFEFKNLN